MCCNPWSNRETLSTRLYASNQRRDALCVVVLVDLVSMTFGRNDTLDTCRTPFLVPGFPNDLFTGIPLSSIIKIMCRPERDLSSIILRTLGSIPISPGFADTAHISI
jgi:hypothetical protein